MCCRGAPLLAALQACAELGAQLSMHDAFQFAPTCRAAAALVARQSEPIQEHWESSQHPPEAKLAHQGYRVQTWISERVTVPSPCCSKAVVVDRQAGSLTIQIRGPDCTTTSSVHEGVLAGMPSWNGDGSLVAVPFLPPASAPKDRQLIVAVCSPLSEPRELDGFWLGPSGFLQQLLWAPTKPLLAVAWWLERHAPKYSDSSGNCLDVWKLNSQGHRYLGFSPFQVADLAWRPGSKLLTYRSGEAMAAFGSVFDGEKICNNCKPLAWAPSGDWSLAQLESGCSAMLSFIRFGPQAYPVAQVDVSVPDINISECLGWTWGSSGIIVALTATRLHLFKVTEGPELEPLHKLSPFGGQLVALPSFHWSPDGQWLACLVRLLGEMHRGAVRLVLTHPASGFVDMVRGQTHGHAPMTMPALAGLSAVDQPTCVWAPDGRFLWVGALGACVASDGFCERLLRFT